MTTLRTMAQSTSTTLTRTRVKALLKSNKMTRATSPPPNPAQRWKGICLRRTSRGEAGDAGGGAEGEPEEKESLEAKLDEKDQDLQEALRIA
eukprot:CAMPEP_0197565140 /NCGR_PEP_ID=MMETSP1320-20131121/31630_1 /TAXON_ID=91990 /ORGANISM="Bolidomonas sp., Strain RCC2347" /LENGTH=91 /DNA_ID=CAMNT_0043127113 /DNA_START=11 /DNA_END=284 /DNA_ORIENTATION=+